MTEESLPEEIRVALSAYRRERTPARWTALSQLSVGDVEVLDALKSMNPEFPDPLPLPVDGLIEDSAQFYQWPVLPDPDDVLHAVVGVLEQKSRG